jgi:hypothetical protein
MALKVLSKLICGGFTVCTTVVVEVGEAFVFFLFWANAPKEVKIISRRIDSCFISFRKWVFVNEDHISQR